MPYDIRKQGDNWCVFREGKEKPLGCHPTEEKAKAQMRAVLAQENKEVQAILVDKSLAANTMQAVTLVPDGYKTHSVRETGDAFLFLQHSPDLFDAKSLEPKIDTGWPAGIGALIGARKSEQPETVDPVVGYIAPGPEGVLDRVVSAIKGGMKPGTNVIKAADGNRYMLIITSNAYKDRENETITTDSLVQDTDRHWKGDDVFVGDNPLLIWHDEKLKIGDIVFSDVREHFLVEVAIEDNTPLARAAFDYYEHPEEPTGASHKFAFYRRDKDADGTYHRIQKLETSILPRSMAANSLTYGGVIPMTDKSKRNEYLSRLFGLENAAELLDEGLEKLNEALLAKGVEHKSTDAAAVETSQKVVADNAELIVALIEDVAVVHEMVDQQKAAEKAYNDSRARLEEEVKALTEQITALKVQLDNRPRSASRATATEIEKDKLPESVTNVMVSRDNIFRADMYPKE